MFCCTLLYVHSSIAITLMGKRELVALLNLSSRCLVMVKRLFLEVPRGCLRFVIVVFPDHTHLLFLIEIILISCSKTIIFVTFSTLIIQIMGKHIQLRYMIRLNSMYPCVVRLIYHRRIPNVLREVVRSYVL